MSDDVKAVVEVKWLLAAFPGSVMEGDTLYLETVNRIMPMPITELAYYEVETGADLWEDMTGWANAIDT